MLVNPETGDPVAPMNTFIDKAIKEHGIKRFALVTGSTVVKGGYHVGGVWKHLDEAGAEYCVVKATWFNGMIFSLPF